MPQKVPKSYDATLKVLVERYPLDWLKFAGIEPEGPVRLVDSEISSITAAADRVIRVEEPSPWLVNIELQASYDPLAAERTLFYSTSLSRRHGLPVRSVVVLLRPDADGPAMSGTWTRSHPRTGTYLHFTYDVIRVWTQSAEKLLQAGPGIFPLAAITNDAEQMLPAIIAKSIKRIETEYSTSIEGRELLTAEFVLLGLRYPAELIEPLMRGVIRMEESTTYQAILAKGINRGREEGLEKGIEKGIEIGRAEGLISSILRIGRRQFQTEPPTEFVRRLNDMTDLSALEAIEDRLLDVTTWDELFGE